MRLFRFSDQLKQLDIQRQERTQEYDTLLQEYAELQLAYNKARQAAITQELSEIVGGAAAV